MAAARVSAKIESFLAEMAVVFEPVGEEMWLVRDPERRLTHVVVYADPRIVTIRAKIMQLPEHNRERFFEDLLRLNVEMMHGAYALEDDTVIWVNTLEFPTLDFEELRASLDAAAVALAKNHARLAQYQGGSRGAI